MMNLLSVSQVARSLGVSRHTVYVWSAEGRMPMVKLGKRTLFHPDEIERWVSERSFHEHGTANLAASPASAEAAETTRTRGQEPGGRNE
jgi:excisionase family DNA binding protein